MKKEVANREPFKYNLSAFLSAARSVTFVMQTEFNDVSEFLEWYKEKQSQMSEDRLMRFMKEKRNIALKQETIDPRGHIDVTVKSNITITEHVVAVLTHKNSTVERIEHKQPPPPPSTSETEVKYQWFFEDISDKDIITLSQEYVDKLESLVQECEDKFASNLL
jgi:hypothetical protein